jgi:hypothetical protein
MSAEERTNVSIAILPAPFVSNNHIKKRLSFLQRREMVLRPRIIARAFFTILLLITTEAFAQLPITPIAPKPVAQAPASPSSPASAIAVPVNAAELTKRVNQDVGIDVEAKLGAWQKELDRIEGDINKPGLRGNALNLSRSDLMKTRGDAEGFWKKLEPVLNKVQEQMDRLPPAPANGQPPEPEQTARFRAELLYRTGC